MNEKQFMTVDGIQVEINDERNILEVLRKNGIKLPTFCYRFYFHSCTRRSGTGSVDRKSVV